MPDSLLQLLQACRRGSTRAQSALFEHYKRPLFAVCLRYAHDQPSAHDLLQEAFLVIFRDLHQYSGAGSFEGWLRRVTVRCALQQLRRRNLLRFADDYDALPDHACATPYDADTDAEAILRMVQALPTGYRTVFNLRCIEGYSYAEIAAELGTTESNIRSQYARACRQLRGQVELLLF